LFEAPAAEENAKRQFVNTGGVPKGGNLFLHAAPVLAVDHAEQIVRPIRQSPRSSVAKGNGRILGKSLGRHTYGFIGYVPDDHGVGAKTQFAVAHDDAESFDNASGLKVAHNCQDRLFVAADIVGDEGEGARRQRDPILYRVDDGLGQVGHRRNPKSM
jgi:hypothetical protein